MYTSILCQSDVTRLSPRSPHPFSLDSLSIERSRLTKLRIVRTELYRTFAFSDKRTDLMHRDPVSRLSFCIVQ